MGSPQHYGQEFPSRALKLIDGLWEKAGEIYPDNGDRYGPLTATFLLSMAYPIVNLPVERIERANPEPFKGYVNDREIDVDLAKRMSDVLGAAQIENAPFFNSKAWAYHHHVTEQAINLADGLPYKIAEKLKEQSAITRAAALPGSQWIAILRNSMAHGGIIYLDKDGRAAYEGPTEYFAFVRGRFQRDDCGRNAKLEAIDVLRVSFGEFKIFLERWVKWLNNKE